MERYIKDVLGLKAKIKPLMDYNNLPADLQKQCKILSVSGVDSLVIYRDSNEFQLSEFQKQSREIREKYDYPIVICFDKITAYQRKCLIENRQPFIVPDNQLYMPYLGIALQEHFKAPNVAGETMTAMAQYILLYFFYQQEQEYYSKLEISKKLDVNLMNVSRGVQELEELSLLETKKKGRSSMVTRAVKEPIALYNKAMPYLRNPVQKKMFVKTEQWLLDLPKSGRDYAYDKYGVDKNSFSTRAIEKKVYLETADKIVQVDPAWDVNIDYMELEVWRYDPTRFTDGNYVDSISYALSLEGDDDMTEKVNINELL